jgi:dihydroflavonol-4-reductase
MRIGFPGTGTAGHHLRPEAAGPEHEVPPEPDMMDQDTAELACRRGAGLEVTLLWRRTSGELTVLVTDAAQGASFELPVAADEALAAFHHPYGYAAVQLRGVDAIVHTAAWFREYYQPGGNDPAQLQRVNVDAVERLLEAAADTDVPVMVHISSATTIGTRPGGQPSDEDTPPDPGWERNGYRASKIRAELVIRGWPEGDGVRVPVIVPAWMWGPRDAAPTASGRLFLAVARGELGAVPRVGSQVVDARDVAAAAVRAITTGAHGRRYIVGGSWHPLPAVTRQIATAAGRRVPREVPSAIAMAGATAIELTARLLRRDPAVTRAGTRILLEGNTQHLDSQRAERELGVTFRPLAATLTDEAAWYRSHGALPIPRDHASSTERTEPSA